MPGPRSNAIISTAAPRASWCALIRISPPPPCLMRLVASSVATMATRPTSVSLKPRSPACLLAARRASAIWLLSVTAMARTSFPTCDGDASADAQVRFDGEFVAQALRAAQPEPETAAGGVAILQRQLDVGDAGTAIFEDQPNAAPQAVIEQ